MQSQILFYRDFIQFTGGHLKVWEYFNHTRQSRHFAPQIFFSSNTSWDASNPWNEMRHVVLNAWRPENAEALFVAGLDWLMLPNSQRKCWPRPVINLVQGVRHGDPREELYQFLKHRAIRICVSEDVAAAVTKTGQPNGPVFIIPNGINLRELPRQAQQRDIDVLVAGLKQPKLAELLDRSLKAAGYPVVTLTSQLPRQAFLAYLARARIAVLLPLFSEGFYLPALEAMALGCLVICPDCVGNRSYCIPGHNCLGPNYTEEGVLDAVYSVLRRSDVDETALLANARRTALEHDLSRERRSYLRILENLNQLW